MDRIDVADEGRRRVAVERLEPTLDCGRFASKRTVGETVRVTANVFADGHDAVLAVLKVRLGDEPWREIPLQALGNDEWQAAFTLDACGRYEFTVCGWVDAFETWHRDLQKRLEAGQDVTVDLAIGAKLIGAAASRATADDDAAQLLAWQQALTGSDALPSYRAAAAEIEATMRRYPDRSLATEIDPPRAIVSDPVRARFSTWYELFPRSCSSTPGQHGTFRDVIAWLPRIESLGFDVLYLPPIHPIGTAFRKGKNNATTAEAGDVGSPWAIGAAAGGHTAILPDLGTLEDFRQLVGEAQRRGIDVALDIAFQCSPDHPYVKEHPRWFKQRPDGTIQYAENPPKKYQDIYPFDFETADWQALWRELTDVVLFWCRQGVRVFRVDNPHTKSFAFWEFLIGEVKRQFPEAIFLSEAFTRPKVMYRLAKLGFSQSYTYFTWRNTKAELVEYFTELTRTEVSEFFRPNLWPNTPDILPEHLQVGGRAAFIARLVLAATLGANYGIYGPAYEMLDHEPLKPGSEEYLHSEKYQLRAWDFSQGSPISELIARVNRARRENVALQWNDSLAFHPTDNDRLLCYSKRSADGNLLVMVVNLNFQGEEHGFVELPLKSWGLAADRPYEVHDLLSENDQTFRWTGERNFIQLDPAIRPAHIFRVTQE